MLLAIESLLWTHVSISLLRTKPFELRGNAVHFSTDKGLGVLLSQRTEKTAFTSPTVVELARWTLYGASRPNPTSAPGYH